MMTFDISSHEVGLRYEDNYIMTDLIEDFYGVYLLYNLNERYKGRTYIGFTVNPNRRITQHNKGIRGGGAKKTDSKGPWEMVLIIHGFPNDISALRFEWAWQNPKKSRRLTHVPAKKTREKNYDYTLRVLSEMLRIGPWNRLPLTVRWLNDNYTKDFPVSALPPLHMPITYGRVAIKRLSENLENNNSDNVNELCYFCKSSVDDRSKLTCLNQRCALISHIICMSDSFMENSTEIIPIEGDCPSCRTHVLWGDLVRKKKGCYKNLTDIQSFSGSEDEI